MLNKLKWPPFLPWQDAHEPTTQKELSPGPLAVLKDLSRPLWSSRTERGMSSWAIGHTSLSWRDAENPGCKLLEGSLLSFDISSLSLMPLHWVIFLFNHQIHFKTAHFVSVSFSTALVQHLFSAWTTLVASWLVSLLFHWASQFKLVQHSGCLC